MPVFDICLFAVALFSGATASVVGFGIGSILTPFMSISYDIDIAIAAVIVPHATATALRCWRLRANIDRDVLTRFGLISAAGGLAGAYFYTQLSGPAMSRILGFLLVLTAGAQLTGLAARWKPHGAMVTVLGALSGLFGGIVGSQGGLRAAAMVSFKLRPATFVATSTAIGLLVDMARVPIYAASVGAQVAALWRPVAIATVGVVVGTVIGERILFGISPQRFGQIVGSAIGLLGVWLLFRAI